MIDPLLAVALFCGAGASVMCFASALLEWNDVRDKVIMICLGFLNLALYISNMVFA